LIAGSDTPIPFHVRFMPGRSSQTGVHFRHAASRVIAQFGAIPMTISVPLPYVSLGVLSPLATISSQLSPISANPEDPGTVAACLVSTIEIMRGGLSSSVSTRAAVPVIKHMGYRPITAHGAPLCDAVALPAPGGDQVAAAFRATHTLSGLPQEDIALVTADQGKHWAPIPVPRGRTAGDFGDFRYSGNALQAVFATRARVNSEYFTVGFDPIPASVTTDGGTTWSEGQLGCPDLGPCVTLIPYTPPGNCNMSYSPRPIISSRDNGIDWTEPLIGTTADECSPMSLVALSPTRELLITGEDGPVFQTTDAGGTWSQIVPPSVPGTNPQYSYLNAETLLPGGALLLTSAPHWLLLRPGARSWCIATSPASRVQALALGGVPMVIGDSLWWLTGVAPLGDARTLHEIAASGIRC
jgi:hypothetical protein